MKNQELYFTNRVEEKIDEITGRLAPNNVFVIVDTNTASYVLPRLQAESRTIAAAHVIKTKEGDGNKTVESLTEIWKDLNSKGATRTSLVINLGGGVITDMGGFAAATFKRGISFINIPTTLLANVDAAIGGKTGVNFNGYKNEIGVFCNADAVIISTTFFNTLPKPELYSGYAELIKHAMISSKENYDKALRYDITAYMPDSLLELLKQSVAVKAEIVEKDPTESGIRKALNFGHTAGHAFEELAMQRQSPIPHGYAVAWGMVVAAILSHTQCGFPAEEVHRLASYVKQIYGVFGITCKDYEMLLELMSHDKKNKSQDRINFTLLTDIGQIEINREVETSEIKAALDIFCDEMGI